jgi:tRNA (guanine37-N1)-methyltransferase
LSPVREAGLQVALQLSLVAIQQEVLSVLTFEFTLISNDVVPLIGEVLLDKHPHIRTVVNKLDSIDSSFRFFKMEVLAGEDDMIAKVKENGCIFEFDFSKVYWNSRLHSEHHRLTTLLKRDEVVVDMFAGVGPFALPAARKGCKVFANDLNPFSHQYLVQNAKLNHLQSLVTAYNQDGRQFVKDVFCQLIDRDPLLLSRGSHVIMNLPASAIEFLDSLNGILQDLPPHLVDSTPLPSVHCYTFTKSATPTEDVLSRVEHTLRTSLPRDTVSVHRVRDVAPNKLMMRVSFQLPHNVAFAPTKKGKTHMISAFHRVVSHSCLINSNRISIWYGH